MINFTMQEAILPESMSCANSDDIPVPKDTRLDKPISDRIDGFDWKNGQVHLEAVQKAFPGEMQSGDP